MPSLSDTSADSSNEESNTGLWLRAGGKRKKFSKKTPRDEMSSDTDGEMTTDVPFKATTFMIVDSSEQWQGDLQVLVVLSQHFPQLNVKKRNNISTTLITAQDQATNDTLSSMTVLGGKPIKFNLLGDKRKISTGIVQRVTVIVLTALLLATQNITEATRMNVWDPIEKTAVPTRIKITWEGSTMPDIITFGYLGNFSVRPYTPDPVRC